MTYSRPALIISEAIAQKNIKQMADKAQANGVELMPHFKTHQSKIIGRWFKDLGIDSITVSSVSMARYFAEDNWQNITIAFPLNIKEIKQIANLAAHINLTLLITDLEQIKVLLSEVMVSVNILLEIDCGSNRSGLPPDDNDTITKMIDLLERSQHCFKGFYSHFGHTYNAASVNEVEDVYNNALNIITDLKHRYGYAQAQISIGDTPSCTVMRGFAKVKSIHPGNFVFYDLMQAQIGVCKEEDIAVVLACPVVSKNKQRCEVVIYGGGVHLSKESLFDKTLQANIYGKIVWLTKDGWSASLPGCYLRSVSQEHGVVVVSPSVYNQISIGDVIGILPVHSCMTADAMGSYVDLKCGVIDHFKGNILATN